MHTCLFSIDYSAIRSRIVRELYLSTSSRAGILTWCVPMASFQAMITRQLFSSITGWIIVESEANKPLSIWSGCSLPAREQALTGVGFGWVGICSIACFCQQHSWCGNCWEASCRDLRCKEEVNGEQEWLSSHWEGMYSKYHSWVAEFVFILYKWKGAVKKRMVM